MSAIDAAMESAMKRAQEVLRASPEDLLRAVRAGLADAEPLLPRALVRADAELAAEGQDLLHLRRVLERERAEKVASLDHRAAGFHVRDGACLGGDERHHHLHGLNLGEGLAGDNLAAVVLQVADELAGDVCAQLRGVELVGKQPGLCLLYTSPSPRD